MISFRLLRFVSLRFIFKVVICLCFSAHVAHAQTDTKKSVVITPQVRAELLAHAPQGVSTRPPNTSSALQDAASSTVWVGLQLTHQSGWHSYWRNPGDSGLPTQLQWTLPVGVMAGDIQWPSPQRLPLGPLVNYGYEGTVLLPVPLTITPDFKPALWASSLSIELKASWLVCRLECIPEEGQFSLSLPLKGSTALHTAAFDAALAARPQSFVAGKSSRFTVQDNLLHVTLAGLPSHLHGKTLDFFPETAEVLNPSSPWQQAWQDEVWTARVPLSAQRRQHPERLAAVLKPSGVDASSGPGWRVELPVSGTWPPVAALTGISPALQAALDGNAATQTAALSLGLFAALIGAFLGGLVLNLMPCVFPVLAIKVLNFTRHANDHRSHRISGLAYTAGVLVSFMALGLLLLGLRTAGESLGWGFHLQSPAVVAVLAMLFTVIGLNLAGVFEFGSLLPSGLAAFQARHPVLDAFLTGVLAVAVASPCSAPFMGASLGLAVTLPAPQALLIFATLGLGLALPYLLASFVPAVAHALPRPGAWMDALRKLLAFPMFATVAWLVWVLGQQSGIDGAGALLAILVALSGVLWSLSLQGRLRIVLATLLMASCLAALGTFGPLVIQLSEPRQSALADERWQAWTPGKVEQLLAEQKPVFVDFTAAWCVTCQYNKKTTLANAEVQAAFDAKGVVMLQADWTRRDPAITAALAQLGRNGVPVYVFYKTGRAPRVLSEILSVQEVREAIDSL